MLSCKPVWINGIDINLKEFMRINKIVDKNGEKLYKWTHVKVSEMWHWHFTEVNKWIP